MTVSKNNLEVDQRDAAKVIDYKSHVKVIYLLDKWQYEKTQPNMLMEGWNEQEEKAQFQQYVCAFVPPDHFVLGYEGMTCDGKYHELLKMIELITCIFSTPISL